MVMILLSIGRLAKGEGFENPNKTHQLKKEVEEDSKVVTDNSVFDYLFARGSSSSKDSFNGPSSRKL